ncbi:universal stress protein [Halegenticoccus tardaugens]|uniref:universal stress protein n=1 Tax=Halegenticoccus tardaugens TaxID=2071624 RepID=UPI00100A70B4|nr:universal stress protein [Halegenticoccus tardaugens]
MYDAILVPTDGSEHAEAAADHAVSIAARYGATVHAVNVVDLTAEAGLFDAGGLPKEFVERLDAEGEKATERIAEKADRADVRVATAVLRGTPHRAILDYASDNDVDLIVMGGRGLTGVHRVLLGSVTERIIQRADAPVLTVQRSSDGS